MLLLIVIGLVGGLITGVSPCVLPMLPIIFFAGGSGQAGTAAQRGSNGLQVIAAPNPARTGHLELTRRPMMIILGLVLSFSVFTLFGSTVLTVLHLPQDILHWAGLVILALVGLGLLFPGVESILQRPFRWIPALFGRRVAGSGALRGSAVGGLVLGLGLGVLYVPCAGPVLAAISIAGSTGRVSGALAALTGAFAVGVAIPLLVFALAGAGIFRRLSNFRRRSNMFRVSGGVVMLLLAVALTFNLTDGLQRSVPAYTQAWQNRVETNPAAQHALAALNGERSGAPPDAARSPVSSAEAGLAPPTAPPPAGAATGPIVTCQSHAASLANCGPAPQLVGLGSWLNTPANQPLSLARLKGKVVLVNFWTFSCINCQRALPAITSWYADYRDSGLVVIGIHTPEFAYEHELSNVSDAVRSDGIQYPVALDNSSATWRNFNNAYWPAEYLIDAQGVLRHVVFGEGGYSDSEALIRSLLRAVNPGVRLPAPVDPTVPPG